MKTIIHSFPGLARERIGFRANVRWHFMVAKEDFGKYTSDIVMGTDERCLLGG